MKKDIWSAVSYLRFADARLIPALDLIQRMSGLSFGQEQSKQQFNPKTILDFGCGPGNITPFLHERYPEAEIVGLDSSQDMINTARKKTFGPKVRFEVGDMTTYIPEKKVDLLYSNAAIHWIPNHEVLLPHIVNNIIAPGGVLAFQIPDTRVQPSHTEMKKVAEELGWGDLVKDVRIPRCEQDQRWYYNLLADSCDNLNIWTTTYAQILQGEDPVANYTASTGLKAVMEALGGEETEKSKTFFEAYKKRMREVYPPSEDGSTLFPFTRFFVVAHKKPQ
eukprot:TRINITY_DN21901_c0_g1_i1.p1 TRINITY_DN21901_c0_g1~~TRINITY_DN21901_c0_g1_i1.p1  ORF type:complete len:278 (-),score=57.31 TRINITY_DN21901_c0_g1_i1:4-837(-)